MKVNKYILDHPVSRLISQMQLAEEGTLNRPWGHKKQAIQKRKDTSFLQGVIKKHLLQKFSEVEQ